MNYQDRLIQSFFDILQFVYFIFLYALFGLALAYMVGEIIGKPYSTETWISCSLLVCWSFILCGIAIFPPHRETPFDDAS